VVQKLTVTYSIDWRSIPYYNVPARRNELVERFDVLVTTRTYVEFYSSAVAVHAPETKQVHTRDLQHLTIPVNVYAIRFFDIKEITYEGDVYKTDMLNVSPKSFIGGKAFTLGALREEHSDKTMLIKNMESNNWPRVILTEFGTWHRMEHGDKIISR